MNELPAIAKFLLVCNETFTSKKVKPDALTQLRAAYEKVHAAHTFHHETFAVGIDKETNRTVLSVDGKVMFSFEKPMLKIDEVMEALNAACNEAAYSYSAWLRMQWLLKFIPNSSPLH